MYDGKNITTWYGMLKTKSQEHVVIYDKRLIPSSKDRICFYHTTRGEIVEFVESIVRKNLYDLTDQQIQTAKEQYQSEWEKIVKVHQKKHEALFKPDRVKKAAEEHQQAINDPIDQEDGQEGDFINIDDLEEESMDQEQEE